MDLTLESLGITLPHSVPAEQSVLGAVLLDPGCISQLVEKLSAEMFFVRQNRAVYTEMLSLLNSSVPIDILVLADRLASDPAFPQEGGSKAYLAEIAATVPSLTNLPHYIDIVREKYIKRQLMQQAQSVLEQAGDDVEADTMLESAEQRLYEIRSGRESSEVQTLRAAIVSVMGYLHKLDGPDREKYLGIKTGFSYLDKVLTGFGKGDLIILASRPGMGKTSFALNISTNIAKRNIPIIFFSLEMSNDQIAGRILSAEALVDSRVFRTGIENAGTWDEIAFASDKLGDLPIYMDDTSTITIPEMRSKIRNINQSAIKSGGDKIGMVVIDYLQLMSTGKRSENRVQEVSEITRNLKIMAKELEIPVLVLSQLSRGAEKNRPEHRPMLSDLRDSGSIEQDADVVMFLFREAYYDDGPEADEGSAECIVAKNRHGDTTTVKMAWDGEHTRYIDIQPERY
ncbi:replicative DNA helicase [Clostridia bacterium OttesenSCG-928-O13]|nr:replicative DNA helicase [Clostridia bacterium OttesenSCG-928-O13]